MFKFPGAPSKKKRQTRAAVRKLAVGSQKSLLDFVDNENKILKKIFRYLDNEDLKSCKLVCKRFNKVVKETWSPGRAWLWLKNEQFIEDVEVYQDMCSGRRDIMNFAVGESEKISPVSCLHNEDDLIDDSWYFLRVQSVIGITYRHNINQIQLMNLEVSITNLLRFLSYPGDFHTLKLFFMNQSSDKKEKAKMPPDELPFIENIVIYDCGPSILKMISFLQPNSIKAFTVKVVGFDQLDEALKKQQSVNKLSLNCLENVPVPQKLLAGHEFTHLTLNVASLVNLSEFLTQFTSTLQFLDVRNAIDNKIFLAITDLESLNSLQVNLEDISGINVMKIAKLKILSSLVLYGGGSLQLEALLSLKSFRLEFFDYPGCQQQESALVKQLKQKFNEEDSIICRKGG